MGTLSIRGGRILRSDMTVTEADVLVDREAGDIVEIGAELAGDDELDADGDLVMPGLVNAHTHVAMTLLRGHADDKPLDVWLREDIWPVEAALEPDDIAAGAALGILEMIKSGTTTFADMYFEIDRTADVVDRTGVRAVLGHGAISAGKDDAAARADIEESIEMARRLDGAADGRISTAVMPHSLTTVTPELLELAASEAHGAGVPVHYHANETVDEVDPIVEERGMRPLEWAAEMGLCTEADFLAHGVYLDDAEVDLLSRRGTGVVHCPASNMKLASGMAPVQRLLDAGVPVGLGTDGAASNNDLDLFDELRDAAMLGKLAADDASAVAAPAAVNMATAGSADVLGLNTGRIEAGAAADLAVIDLDAPHLTPEHDIVSHLAYAVRGSDVRHTICDGEVLMRDREVLTMDETAVMARAAERAEGLLDRAGV